MLDPIAQRFEVARWDLRDKAGLVVARDLGRRVAGALGFDAAEQTRVAAVVSELVRNALTYANGGTVRFSALLGVGHQALEVEVSDHGPGLETTRDERRYRRHPPLGLETVQRVADDFQLESQPEGGVRVRAAFRLPPEADDLQPSRLTQIREQLLSHPPTSPLEELERQNRELLTLAEELQRQAVQLRQLNAELESSNRGVVALTEELNDKNRQLEDALTHQRRFLSIVSHEFRTPLHSILSVAQMLRERLDGPLTDEQAKQVTIIHRNARALLHLVEDLLESARLERGELRLHRSRFAVQELCRDLMATIRPLVLGQVKLNVELPRDPPVMESDRHKVTQVLRNLLANAVKFTTEGAVTLRVEQPTTDQVRFSVEDTGPGIPPEVKGALFQPFSPTVDKGPVRGVGLGLWIVRQLTEALGGEVAVESEPGRGSTFTVQLPLKLPRAAANGS